MSENILAFVAFVREHLAKVTWLYSMPWLDPTRCTLLLMDESIHTDIKQGVCTWRVFTLIGWCYQPQLPKCITTARWLEQTAIGHTVFLYGGHVPHTQVYKCTYRHLEHSCRRGETYHYFVPVLCLMQTILILIKYFKRFMRFRKLQG